jgi:DNA-binding NarL/FixJ family response regulator
MALLDHFDMTGCVDFENESHFADAMADSDAPDLDVVVLLLQGASFATIHRVRETLGQIKQNLPLLILSEQVGRGQIYAALRIGAKAYLGMDCTAQELATAIASARQEKVYLSSTVAELLVNDVSASLEPNASMPQIELSRREVEIVQLLCDGLSAKEVARQLHLSVKTIENHRYNIYRKCEVDSIAGLMRYAIQHALITI